MTVERSMVSEERSAHVLSYVKDGQDPSRVLWKLKMA
jgi:hypothetical protein